jgi:hypothetical protein
VNEVQEAVNSPHEMVQAHALALLYEIKHRDRLAVSKLVLQVRREGGREGGREGEAWSACRRREGIARSLARAEGREGGREGGRGVVSVNLVFLWGRAILS